MTADWIDPPQFATAVANSPADHPCMPQRANKLGAQVNIAAPQWVAPRAYTPFFVPVCMRGIVPVFDPPVKPKVVARDIESGATYEGEITIDFKPKYPPGVHVDVDPRSIAKPVPVPPGMKVGQQFVADLVGHAGIPRKAATYEVYVISGGVQSDTALVEIRL